MNDRRRNVLHAALTGRNEGRAAEAAVVQDRNVVLVRRLSSLSEHDLREGRNVSTGEELL